MNYHAREIGDILQEFTTSEENGLSDEQARARRVVDTTAPPRAPWRQTIALFFEQWKSPLLLILLVAGVVSGLLREFSDMAIIFLTATINAIIGFFEEYKASAALAKLQALTPRKTMVLRGGKPTPIEASEVVPGDIIVFAAGDTMVADARIVAAYTLQVNEAPLTGESAPVHKYPEICDEDTPLAERTSMIYSGTTAMNGRGVAVVVAVGAETEIGKIASLVEKTHEEKTPLQLQLAALGKKLGYMVGIIAVFVLVLGFFTSRAELSILQLFQTSVALAVAAIPEGLVITVTVILAIGMQHILRRKALVRKLLAAETLGSVTIICTDKTGTLTEGIMSVTEVYTAAGRYSDDALPQTASEPSYLQAQTIAALCNDALRRTEGETVTFLGDTTEAALAAWTERSSIRREILEERLPRVAEIPFESTTKYMATLHKAQHGFLVAVKGGSDILLPKTTHILDGATRVLCTPELLLSWRAAEERMTAAGLRVLALAYKEQTEEILDHANVQGLTMVALVGMSDPIRVGVAETIQQAAGAGIRTIMMTGDHERTAYTIGAELGLVTDRDEVVNGAVLDTADNAALDILLQEKRVFARVSPEHKLRIVQALQRTREVVAMTGDGVNDAPALKAANVGIALGSGTDVAKEVADMVLLHDSFETIVAAIFEGRRIYQNIQTVVLYLLAGSLSEVVLIVGSMLGHLPLALLPVHILWINIVQESFLTMTLAFDPAHKDTMREPPRAPQAHIIDRTMVFAMVVTMLIVNSGLFMLYMAMIRATGDIVLSRTMLFAGLGLFCTVMVYPLRGLHEARRRIPIFGNWYLTMATLGTGLLLFLSTEIPLLRDALRLTPLAPEAWLALILLATLLTCAIEWVVQRMPRFFSSSSTL